ncbi:MAG TPA: hypothetical protein DD827_10510 [Gammaproteobacteria bacterium]|nr:hypothetical protein [Gammaproteobacteria bacterium]
MDALMQRLQDAKERDAPSETEKCLIMLLCSCTRKISASMHKTSKVTTDFSVPLCTPMTCRDALMQRLQDTMELWLTRLFCAQLIFLGLRMPHIQHRIFECKRGTAGREHLYFVTNANHLQQRCWSTRTLQ